MALPFKWLPYYRSLAIMALVVVLVVIQWRDRSQIR